MRNELYRSIKLILIIIIPILFSCESTRQTEMKAKDENLLEDYRVIQRIRVPAKGDFVYCCLTLTPDGKRLAYLCKKGKIRDSLWIGNKKVSPNFDLIWENFAFCSDGSKVAYSAKGSLNNMSIWLNNNRISPEFYRTFDVVFSPDCSRVAYRAIAHRDLDPAKKWGKYSIWIDGKRVSPEGSHAYPGKPLFSPDGSKLAYIVEVGKKWSAWINDKKVSPEFEVIEGDLIFSPDGSSAAYTVRRDKIPSIWINGKLEFDNAIGPVFSPDGSNIAYRKVEGGVWSVYINDKKVSPEFRSASGLVFSPDGSKVAYSAKEGGENKSVWINDKKVSADFSGTFVLIKDLALSPDGSSVAYRVSYLGKHESIWINDKRVSQEFRNVKFAKEHFSKTGEVIFAGFNREKQEILHAITVRAR